MPPLLEGTLYKLHAAPRFHRGGSRLIVVDDYSRTLIYYASSKAYDAEKPSRTLDLATITAIESLEDECSFRIIAEARTLTLRAQSTAERDEWVSGLRLRTGERHSSPSPARPLGLLSWTAAPEGKPEEVAADDIEERVADFFARRRGEMPEAAPVPSGAAGNESCPASPTPEEEGAAAQEEACEGAARSSPPPSASRGRFSRLTLSNLSFSRRASIGSSGEPEE